jgi:hypothetical protein
VPRHPHAEAWNRNVKLTTTYQEVSAPMVWPPPLTFAETRAVAEEVLPGVAYRRHVLGRYSLTWVREGAGAAAMG